MKKIYTYILLMACAMMFASCQKELDGVFTAVIENYSGNNGKVHLNGENYACWDRYDPITGYVNTNTKLQANINIPKGPNENPNTATLTFYHPNSPNIYNFKHNDKFTAIYAGGGQATPVSATEVKFADQKVILYKSDPNYPDYPDSPQSLGAPMVATTTYNANGCNLRFYNLAALIKMHITNNSGAEIKINEIKLTSLTEGVYLNGTQSFTQEDGQAPDLTPGFTQADTEPSTMTVTCRNGWNGKDFITIPQNGSCDLYIHVPANQTCQYQVDVYAPNPTDPSSPDYYNLFSKATKSVTIERSHIATMPISIETIPPTPPVDNSDTDPYLIRNRRDLMNWMQGEGLSKSYKLMCDITLPLNFEGFGTENTPFTGTFDGNGHTITNGTITNKSKSGIFVAASNYTIKNLKVKVYMKPTTMDKGGLINITQTRSLPNGHPIGGKIENCIVSGTISSTKECVGGFIGKNNEKNSTIKNCINATNITAWFGPVGGFIGTSNTVSLINCVNKGNLEATYQFYAETLGGFIGSVSVQDEPSTLNIQNSYTLGNIKGEKYIGGIIGEWSAQNNKCNIENVYVYASLTTTQNDQIPYAILANNLSTGVEFNGTNVFVPSSFIHTNETGAVIKDLYGDTQPEGDLKDNVTAIPDDLLGALQGGQNGHADWSAWVDDVIGNNGKPGLDFENALLN